ncbi:MAG: FeoA domain-containing protein [Actinomycetaceae bacterium]|nr:FeoA domain-containing protein [Actinomycetaceae bacterium]MDY6083480.1 FeoA domain-containing protein [Actinomycetaceae bacterium]
MRLIDCPRRTELRLLPFNVEAASALRMQELGLRAGMRASVVQHAAFGGLVLNIAGSRVAVDHQSAQLINAEVVNGSGIVTQSATDSQQSVMPSGVSSAGGRAAKIAPAKKVAME